MTNIRTEALPEYLTEQLRNAEPAEPVYTEQLAGEAARRFCIPREEAETTVKANIAKILEEKIIPELRVYIEGVLYRTRVAFYGEVGINKNALLFDKYIRSGIGYETGPAILNRLGLTTWMCRDDVYATNAVTEEQRNPEFNNVILRPGKTTITEENRFYLQILDVMEILRDSPVNCSENCYAILARHINKRRHKYRKLLALAYKYYDKPTQEELAKTAIYAEKKRNGIS